MMPPWCRSLPRHAGGKAGLTAELAQDALPAHRSLSSKWLLKAQLPQLRLLGGMEQSWCPSSKIPLVQKGPTRHLHPGSFLVHSKAREGEWAILKAMSPGGPTA